MSKDRLTLPTEYVFANFVSTAGTEDALYACLVAAMKPENCVRMIIEGEAGLGKTHLGVAAAQYCRETRAASRSVYVSFDLDFMDDDIVARNIEHIRGADLAIIDNAHAFNEASQMANRLADVLADLRRKGATIILLASPGMQPSNRALSNELRDYERHRLLPPDLEERRLLVIHFLNRLNWQIGSEIQDALVRRYECPQMILGALVRLKVSESVK